MTKGIEDYHRVAKSKNLTYILNWIPKTIKTSVKGWKCKWEHIFEARYNNIEYAKNNGCSECARNQKKLLEDYKNVGLKNGIEYILNEVPTKAE